MKEGITLAQLKEDGPGAFSRLFTLYYRDLVLYAGRYLTDQTECEDIVQETFLKAYRHLDAFRRESSEKTWLVRIAINACNDLRRSRWFRLTDRRVTPEELPEAACAPHDTALGDAILRLPRKQREAVLLYY